MKDRKEENFKERRESIKQGFVFPSFSKQKREKEMEKRNRGGFDTGLNRVTSILKQKEESISHCSMDTANNLMSFDKDNYSCVDHT